MGLRLPRRLRVRGVEGAGRVKRVTAFKPPAPPRTQSPTSGMPDRIRRAFYALCGDFERREKLAWRFAQLLEENSAITLPEALLYVLLEERDIKFDYQSALLGGRQELGGLVVDFIIDMGGYALAVLVNGDYWHTLPAQMLRDDRTKEEVVGQSYEGVVISLALSIWESTLLGCNRERAVELLLTGVEVGRDF